MSMRPIKKGSTDQSIVIRIIDSTDGTPETAVEHDTSGIDLWYRREGATKTSLTEAALASLDAAHSDGGIEAISDGYYRLDLPDAAVAAGANGVMVGGAVTGMIVIGCYVPLVDYDPYDADALGLANLNLLATRVTLSGTADAGDSTVQITLTGGVATDKYYNGQTVIITGGTGAGQARTILNYIAAGTVATPTRDWAVAPDGTSTFAVFADDVPAILEAGVATAGADASITLDATASATADIYKNNFVMITGGTGAGQTRLIVAYSAGRVATIMPNWTVNPDATSIYQVLPMARVDVQGWLGSVVTGDGDWAALKAETALIVEDTAEIGAAGVGLTEAGGDGDHLTEAGGTGDQLTAITANTDDLADGQRLDLILDAILADTNELQAGADADATTSLTLEQKVLRIYQFLLNKMVITDATGAVALRNEADDGDLATNSITDNDTSTTRTALSWA